MFELASCTSYPILSERPLIASSKWILVCSAGGMGSSPVPVQSSSCEWGRESSRRSEHREVILHSEAHSTQRHSDALRWTQMDSDALRCTQMDSDALRGTQRHIPHALKMDSDELTTALTCESGKASRRRSSTAIWRSAKRTDAAKTTELPGRL